VRTGHFSKTARSGAPPFLLVNTADGHKLDSPRRRGPPAIAWLDQRFQYPSSAREERLLKARGNSA